MSRLLVLRPEPGAAASVRAARLAGIEAIAAPLFTVRPLDPGPPPAFEAQALLLTSANAVRHGADWAAPFAGLPVYAVGEATAAAARRAGWTVAAAGTGDAAAILARAGDDGVTRLLHLAGREHRAVVQLGIGIERAIVYASEGAERLPEPARAALRQGAVALLHSPRAASLFARLVDGDAMHRASIAIAALSPAVAETVGAGWRAVAIAPQPTDAALLAAAAKLCE